MTSYDDSRHDTFASVASRRLLISRWKPRSRSRTLWDEAVAAISSQKLSKHNLEIVAAEGNPSKVLDAVNEKLEECKRKQLKWKKSDGTEVVISTKLERIAGYIDTFKEVGDQIVQYGWSFD